jgi:hypothetical protein
MEIEVKDTINTSLYNYEIFITPYRCYKICTVLPGIFGSFSLPSLSFSILSFPTPCYLLDKIVHHVRNALYRDPKSGKHLGKPSECCWWGMEEFDKCGISQNGRHNGCIDWCPTCLSPSGHTPCRGGSCYCCGCSKLRRTLRMILADFPLTFWSNHWSLICFLLR